MQKAVLPACPGSVPFYNAKSKMEQQVVCPGTQVDKSDGCWVDKWTCRRVL